MLLKPFFGSRTRVKLLELFLLNSQSEFFIREISRRLRMQVNSVIRELKNLKKCGLLTARTRNHRKFYTVNQDFELLAEFKSIIRKTADPQVEIAKNVQKFGTVDLLLLSGQFIGNPTMLTDMLIVGELDKESLKNYLEHELTAEQKVRFTVISRADFLHRLDCQDTFLFDLLQSSDQLISINKLENYINLRLRKRK